MGAPALAFTDGGFSHSKITWVERATGGFRYCIDCQFDTVGRQIPLPPSLSYYTFPDFSCGVRFAFLPRYENRSCTPSGKISRPKLSQVRRLFRRHSLSTSIPLFDPGGERLVQALQLPDCLGAGCHRQTTISDKTRPHQCPDPPGSLTLTGCKEPPSEKEPALGVALGLALSWN